MCVIDAPYCDTPTCQHSINLDLPTQADKTADCTTEITAVTRSPEVLIRIIFNCYPKAPPRYGRKKTPVTGFSLAFNKFSGGASRSRTDLHGFAIRCITALLSRRAYLTIGTANLKTLKNKGAFCQNWSGRRVSNSRPIPWQGIALPTELLPRQTSAHYKDLR